MLLGVLLVFKFNKMAMILIVQFHYTKFRASNKIFISLFQS